MAWWKPWGGRRQEQRSVSIGDPVLAAMLGYSSPDGVTVSESTAMTLSAVFRAVSLVSGALASLPLRTLIEKSDGTKTRSRSFLDTPGGKDRRFTAFEWKQLVAVLLLLHGNAYLQHVYNGAGALVALYPVHPNAVTPAWDDARPGGKRFDVRVTTKDGAPRTVSFDSTTMTQIMGVSLDGLTGVSPITMARLSMGTGLSGDKAANRMFQNGAMISGLVTPEDGEDITEDEAKVVKSSVNAKMTGLENAGSIAVLNKRLKFQAWQMNAADAQFLESRTFSIDEIGRWFGVPPHLLGLTEKSTSWGQGIAEQNRGLARYTLTPWTSAIDERLTLLLGGGKTAEFDYTAFVQPSPEDEITLILAQVNGGLITPNEGRRIRNLAPVPGGDVLRLPAGSAPTAPPAEPEKVAA